MATDNKKPDKRREAALNLAASLCLKLLERRVLGPADLPEALKLLRLTAMSLLTETQDGNGLWLTRQARDFCGRLIERGALSQPQDVAISLVDHTRMLAAVAAQLPEDQAPAALNAARELILKMLETGRLSQAAITEQFERLAKAAVWPGPPPTGVGPWPL